MKYFGAIENYISFLKSFEGTEEDLKQSIQQSFEHRPRIVLDDIKVKHFIFSSVFLEAIQEIRLNPPVKSVPEKTVQKEYDKTFFLKTIGANSDNFRIWKDKGFFKNEIIISERKSKVTIEDINEFLADSKYKRWREKWEQKENK